MLTPTELKDQQLDYWKDGEATGLPLHQHMLKHECNLHALIAKCPACAYLYFITNKFPMLPVCMHAVNIRIIII